MWDSLLELPPSELVTVVMLQWHTPIVMIIVSIVTEQRFQLNYICNILRTMSFSKTCIDNTQT